MSHPQLNQNSTQHQPNMITKLGFDTINLHILITPETNMNSNKHKNHKKILKQQKHQPQELQLQQQQGRQPQQQLQQQPQQLPRPHQQPQHP